jgi:hypothetical protein
VVESCFDGRFRQDHGVACLGRFQRHRFDGGDSRDLGTRPAWDGATAIYRRLLHGVLTLPVQ